MNLSARGPSASEAKLAAYKNVKLAVKPIARHALVFIVNALPLERPFGGPYS